MNMSAEPIRYWHVICTPPITSSTTIRPCRPKLHARRPSDHDAASSPASDAQRQRGARIRKRRRFSPCRFCRSPGAMGAELQTRQTKVLVSRERLPHHIAARRLVADAAARLLFVKATHVGPRTRFDKSVHESSSSQSYRPEAFAMQNKVAVLTRCSFATYSLAFFFSCLSTAGEAVRREDTYAGRRFSACAAR